MARIFIPLILVALIGCQNNDPKKTINETDSVGVVQDDQAVEIFSTTTNPYDHLFDPMPLRVGTEGSTYFHRPFSPRAQQSLIQHGEEKRINYYSMSDIPSNRIPAPDSMSDIFLCPTDPVEFANSDDLCLRSRQLPVTPDIPAGYVVCVWDSYTLLVVPASNCSNGTIATQEDTPVEIEFVYFNTLPSVIGDADNDGDIDEVDFEYLVECYSGNSQASRNCRNCFDYDEDGDVDIDDFDVFFVGFGSSNEDWVVSNFPNASQVQPVPLPLRVGMTGSSLYHQPDCPAVLRSRDTHGWHKFIEFYTREKIESSNRQPDTRGLPHGCDATLQLHE